MLNQSAVKLLVAFFRMMAQNVWHSRAPNIILFVTIILSVCRSSFGNVLLDKSGPSPTIDSVKIVRSDLSTESNNELNQVRFLVEVTGAGISRDLPLTKSFRNSDCDCDVDNELRQVSTTDDGSRAFYEITLEPKEFKVNDVIYFCILKKTRSGDAWTNLGPDHAVTLPDDR